MTPPIKKSITSALSKEKGSGADLDMTDTTEESKSPTKVPSHSKLLIDWPFTGKLRVPTSITMSATSNKDQYHHCVPSMIEVNTIAQTMCQSARQCLPELTLPRKPVFRRPTLSSAIHRFSSNTRHSHVDNEMIQSFEREHASSSNSSTAHHLDFQLIISKVSHNKILISLPDMLDLEDEQQGKLVHQLLRLSSVIHHRRLSSIMENSLTDNDMSTRSEQPNSSSGNSGTSPIKSRSKCDEILTEWPNNRDKPVRYPPTITSEYGANVSSKKNGMVISNSLPDMLDLSNMELLPCPRE